MILQRDVRTPPTAERRLQGHRQEVCGLKWSPDHQHLASGGNDNKVCSKCSVLTFENICGSQRTYSSRLTLVVSRTATGVEQLQPSPGAAVRRPLGGGEGDRLVSTPARAAGVRGRHRRPMPTLLEHANRSGAAEHGHGLAGLQPGMVQTCQ